jgi:formate dehydrogenase
MMILSLVRNYIPSHQWVIKGGWNIADCAERSYDVEGMHVGTVAAGRIGLAVLRRLKPFDMHLHYTDRHRLPEAVEKELGLAWHPNVEDMVKVCDVVTINAPLHPETENLFNDKLLSKMKRGAYLVNTARGKICDRDAIVRALESGRLGGYAGDVWFPQPAPKDHPWRTMPHHGMTPHISGTSLSAQARYAAGTREILECWFEGRPIRDEYLIVDGGKLAGAGGAFLQRWGCDRRIRGGCEIQERQLTMRMNLLAERRRGLIRAQHATPPNLSRGSPASCMIIEALPKRAKFVQLPAIPIDRRGFWGDFSR